MAARPADAGPMSFSVQPLTAEVAVQPGGEATGVLRIGNDPDENGGGDPVRLRVYAMDWTLNRKGTPQFMKAASDPRSCAAWVRVNPVELDVAPGKTAEVRYTVRVPKEAQGSYHTVIMVESAPSPARAKNGKLVGVNGRIGSILYLHAGPVARRARITRFSAGAQQTLLTLENTGNSAIRVRGTVKFLDSAGKPAKQVPLPGGVVLSGANNVRDIVLSTPKLPDGSYTAEVLLDYGGAALLGARTNVVIR
jgi:hypothetical protein